MSIRKISLLRIVVSLLLISSVFSKHYPISNIPFRKLENLVACDSPVNKKIYYLQDGTCVEKCPKRAVDLHCVDECDIDHIYTDVFKTCFF